MKALVLIGGFGTRLRPITYEIPKQLIPIAGKPMLYHVLDLLPPDTEEVVLATGYKAEVIARHVREHPPPFPVRCVSEAEPLGTGGGMRNAGDGMSDPFLLLNSDVIAAIDVPALLEHQRRLGGVGAMTLAEVEDTRPYGVAALDPTDRIERFVEKPTPDAAPSHWINAGCQAWRAEVLELIPRGRPVSFETEIMPKLLPRGVYGYRSYGFWEDAGTPERLLNAQRLLFDAGRVGAFRRPEGSTGSRSVAADPSVRATGARLGPYVSLGAGVTVGRDARVENSVLMDGVVVGPGAVVSGSILGPAAVVPAGARVERSVLGAEPRA